MGQIEATCGCVILNYNSADESIRLAEDLARINCVAEVVIVDNKSTDDSAVRLSKVSDQKIDVVYASDNSGYAAGNNIGIKELIKNKNIKYICISNPDIEIDEKQFEGLLRLAESIGEFGELSCDYVTNYNRKSPAGWKLPGFKECVLEQLPLLGKTLLKNNYPKMSSGLEKVDVLVGSFFILNSQAIEAVGFFDERTFLYYEENILAFKLKENKYTNYLSHDFNYFHAVSASIEQKYKSYLKRDGMVFDGRKIYCTQYLHVGRIKMLFLRMTHFIGLIEILCYQGLKRALHKV